MSSIAQVDPLQYIEQQRIAAWKQLAKREPELVRQIEKWDRAIAVLKNSPGEFAAFRSGTNAAMAYLRRHGPTHIREVCKAVTEGGWASEHPDAYWKMWDAMKYQLERSVNPKIIALGNEVIGLPAHLPAKQPKRKSG